MFGRSLAQSTGMLSNLVAQVGDRRPMRRSAARIPGAQRLKVVAVAVVPPQGSAGTLRLQADAKVLGMGMTAAKRALSTYTNW